MAGNEIVSSASQLKPADHISFPAEYCCGTYQHHAIVLAIKGCNKIKIIHAALKAEKGEWCRGLKGHEVRVQEIPVDKRIARGELVRYKYDPDECSDDDIVMSKAKSKIGNYYFDAISHNCQHFALWCKDKTKDSGSGCWGLANCNSCDSC